LLTEANVNQDVSVPRGTIVEVVLENRTYGPWSIPQGSDSAAMPRVASSSRCVSPVIATFRADGSATIRAMRGNGEFSQDYKVSIRVE